MVILANMEVSATESIKFALLDQPQETPAYRRGWGGVGDGGGKRGPGSSELLVCFSTKTLIEYSHRY